MFYVIVHGIPVLATTGLMSLMSWILSTTTQNRLRGGDDATSNLPGFVFLYAFFPMMVSICTIGLWLVDVYHPPLVRAPIQVVMACVSGVVAFFLGWDIPWSVFLGGCPKGSIYCRSAWKAVVKIEGASCIMTGIILVLELVDALAALRLWHMNRVALRRLVGLNSIRARYSS